MRIDPCLVMFGGFWGYEEGWGEALVRGFFVLCLSGAGGFKLDWLPLGFGYTILLKCY